MLNIYVFNFSPIASLFMALYIYIYTHTHTHTHIYGAWGSVVVKALRYWSDGPGIDSRLCHWGFFP